MINIEEGLKIVTQGKLGEPISVKDWEALEGMLTSHHQRMRDYEQIITLDQKQMKRAAVLFKRAKGWPTQIMPSLSELLEWLLDRSLVEQSLFFKRVLEELVERLDELGPPLINKTYEVDGVWLMSVRVKIINALMYGRPAGRRPRSASKKPAG